MPYMDFSTFNINMNTGCCKYNLNFELSDVSFDENVTPTITSPLLTHSSTGTLEKIEAPDNTESIYEFYIRYSSTFDAASSSKPLNTNCLDLLGTPTNDVQFF